MAEFKGTKGGWDVSKNHQTVTDCEGYGICQIAGITNEDKWEANALLISKAPEMLEMLIQVSKHHQGGHSEIGHKIKKLIKEATEL